MLWVMCDTYDCGWSLYSNVHKSETTQNNLNSCSNTEYRDLDRNILSIASYVVKLICCCGCPRAKFGCSFVVFYSTVAIAII